MGKLQSRRFRRVLVLIGTVLVTSLATLTAGAPAFADTATITGTVQDSSGNPEGQVVVDVIDPSTAADVASTTTDAQGDFNISVASGTYNLEFIPPADTGLQSFLATGVSTNSAPLTVVLKPAVVVTVHGSLGDSEGDVFGSSVAQFAEVDFSSPQNPGSEIRVDSSGSYSADLLADQNVMASAFVELRAGPDLELTAPVGALESDQELDLSMPVSRLSVSVQDSGGAAVTGGQLEFDFGEVSPVPGIPGSTELVEPGNTLTLDGNGDVSMLVPQGVTLDNTRIVLNSGLVIPFTAPVMTGDKSVTVTVPPSVHLHGSLGDSEGDVFGSSVAQFAEVDFSSPQNPGSEIRVDSSGSYSADLLADQNVMASAFVELRAGPDLELTAPVGALESDQELDLSMPVSRLSVSVQDSGGAAVTGGQLEFDFGEVSPVPGIPGSTELVEPGNTLTLDGNGDVSMLVPQGVTLDNTRIVLNSGLVIPFTLHPITGDRHAFIIFNRTTGTVSVDDQPPNVTGTPDRQPNANGWYNAPVTITWSSVDPPFSSGTPNTPDPTTVTGEGTSQAITSGKSCDPAGNCATGSVTLSLDETPPDVAAAIHPAANAAGWYNSDPTIHYTCSDALSGVAMCPADQTVSTDGIGQIINVSALDHAGNTASKTTVLDVDTTPPVASNATLSSAVIADGGTTSLTADVSDSLSGVAAAEYFAGADPGQGNGTAMTVANGTATASIGPDLAPGMHTVSVRAQDQAGNWSAPVTVKLAVKPGAPSGLSAPSPAAQPMLSWTGVPGATSYNIYRDGAVVGTATSPGYTDTTATAGPHSYQVTAVADGVESDPSDSVSVLVGTVPAITSAGSASTGQRVPFDFTVTTTGAPTPTLTETGALPAGLTFTDNGDGTADISGIPAAGTAGSYPLTISASNGIGGPVTLPFVLTVTNATSPPAFTNDPVDTETFGVPFSFTITTTGFPAPKLTKSGALPPGVTFTDNGDGTATISGTAASSAVGNYPLTVTAKNSVGTTTAAFTLVITKAPVIKKVPSQTGQTGKAFSKTITAVGSPAPALTESGALPAGTAFTDNGDGTATLAGTPASDAGGSYSITVTAKNSLGVSSQTFTLKIDQPPAITSPVAATATIGDPFSYQVTTTGYPAPRLTKLGTLPKGLTFRAGAGTITGTPATGTAGTYQVVISAKNSTGTTETTLTITVS